VKTNTDDGIQIQAYYLHAPATQVQVRDTECVRKRNCYSMAANNISTSLREACRRPARSPLLKRMGYASNGHHCATYKNGFPEQQSNSKLMFERANPVKALKNETTSELRANRPHPTTVLFHFHYFYVLLTFERVARKKHSLPTGDHAERRRDLFRFKTKCLWSLCLSTTQLRRA